MKGSYNARTPRASAQDDVVARLAAAGLSYKAIWLAIGLMKSGRSDLIEKVIAGRLPLTEAMKLARQL
jgi:hypothetical protein